MAEALRIVSVSGGKDSTAMYLWAIEQWGKDGFLSVFADTGHEHPVTLNYLRNLPAMAKGPEIKWLKANFDDDLKRKGIEPSGIPFLDMLLFKRMMPSGRHQFCTTHLKLQPISEWLSAIRGEKDVTIYLGIRAEESARRAKLPQKEFSDYYACTVERPILNWEVADVWAIIRKHNVDPNPLYQHGLSRVGCFPCINANKTDLQRLPDWAWDRIKDWENKLGVPWFKPGMANFENPTIEDIRAWSKTEHGGKTVDPRAEGRSGDVPHCMATWGHCE